MKTLIEGYRSTPGEHCGSVAMRSLLRHYCGLELPEEVVFGLGSGIDCVYLPLQWAGPAAVIFGRTVSMEIDLAANLSVDYVEQTEPDDARAWQQVRDEVLVGRPTMLSGDIFYLDYREYKVHFPGHRFVLLGFDDEREVAYIADRIREEPEVCSYGALFASRNPPEGLSTKNLWGRFRGREVAHDLDEATRRAIALCARRMLGGASAPLEGLAGVGEGGGVSTGVAGIRRVAGELPRWAARDDARSLASYNASCIEKFGNGGGNFRRLYAGFLEWAHRRNPELAPAEAAALARRAADGWTSLAQALWAAADGEDRWQEAARLASDIAGVEQDLFERLAGLG